MNGKWIIGGILLLAVAGFGGYKLLHHYNTTALMQNVAPTTAEVTSSPPTAGLSNKNTSNQQLDSDLQDARNSMNQLNQDQGMSSKDVGNQSLDIPQQ